MEWRFRIRWWSDLLLLAGSLLLALMLFAGRLPDETGGAYEWPFPPTALLLVAGAAALLPLLVGGGAPLAALFPGERACFAARALVLLLLVPVVKHWRLFSFDAVDRLAWGMDFHGLFYPFRDWLARRLLAGDFPIWTDHLLAGYPAAGSPHAAVFYPPHWLLALCVAGEHVPYAAVEYFGVLHLTLAGLGTVYLARQLSVDRAPALLAGLAFALAGAMNVLLLRLGIVETFAWFPLVWAELVRTARTGCWRAALRGGLWLGLACVSGHLQTILFGLAGGVPLALAAGWNASPGRVRLLARVSAAAALGLALGAVQILPTLALGEITERTIHAYQYASMGSTELPHLIGLLLPGLDEANDRGRLVYLGLPVLVLGALALRGSRCPVRWTLAALALLCLLYGMGKDSAVFDTVLAAARPLKVVRIPSRAVLVTSLCWSVLAGMGLGDLLRGDREAARVAARWMGLLAGLGVIILTGCWGAQLVWGPQTAPLALLLGAAAHLALIAALGAAGFAILARGGVAPAVFAAGLGVLVVLDLAAPRMLVHVSPRDRAMAVYGPRPMLAQVAVEQARDPFRIAHVGLPGNAGLYYGVDSSSGWGDGFEPLGRLILAKELGDLPFWQLEGVRYLVHPEALPGHRVLARDAIFHLLEMPAPWPPDWPAGAATAVDFDEGVGRAKTTDLRRTPLLELVDGGPLPELNPRAADGTVWLAQRTETARVYECSFPAPGLLVTTIPLWPGWRAEVDGTKARLLRANLAYAALPVPAGDHTVRLDYRLPRLRAGAAITLLALVVLGVGLAVRPRRTAVLESGREMS